MIKRLFILICLCSFISGCGMMHSYSSLPVDQWLESPGAKTGYIYLPAIIPMTISELFIKVNELNKNDDIERIRLVIDVSGESAGPLFDELMRCVSISEKPVDVINIGGCAGPSCVALYASATGRKYAFPDAAYKFISRKLKGNRSEIEKLMEFKIERYVDLMRENTGLPVEYYSKENGLTFFTAKEAKEYGLIDEIITELP